MYLCAICDTHTCHFPLPWFWTCHMLMQWLGIIRIVPTKAVGSMQQSATSKFCLCPHVHVLSPISLQLSFQAHKNAAYSVCVKPDTGFIVTGGEGNMYIWGEWMGMWRLPPPSGSEFIWCAEGSGNYAWPRDEHMHSRISQLIATDYRLFWPQLMKMYMAKHPAVSFYLIGLLIRSYASSLTSSRASHKLNSVKKIMVEMESKVTCSAYCSSLMSCITNNQVV